MNENIKILPLASVMSQKKPRTVGMKNAMNCPFCQKEKMLLENKVLEVHPFLWVENKYPLLKNTYQTLLVETLSCEQDFTNYSTDYAHALLTFAMEKRKMLLEEEKFAEVLLFKNHGFLSDSSIHHAHMQIVGLHESSYDKLAFETSVRGPVVFEGEGVMVTVSEVPNAEFYEFNVKWEKSDTSPLSTKWIQHLIRYVSEFKDGAYESYNLAFHDTNTHNFLKIIPRKPVSIYFLGYGLKQTPDDTKKIAEEIRTFSTSYES